MDKLGLENLIFNIQYAIIIEFEVNGHMSRAEKLDFDHIVKDILTNEEFKKLDTELHHGITRYNHSLRVAKATYKCAKALKLDYKEATRAALMHDFYINEQFEGTPASKVLSKHPDQAALNSKKHFNISELQENIIRSHMFPMSKEMPKFKESWVVTAVDKSVAAYEMYRFKASLYVSIFAIFIFNLITMQR